MLLRPRPARDRDTSRRCHQGNAQTVPQNGKPATFERPNDLEEFLRAIAALYALADNAHRLRGDRAGIGGTSADLAATIELVGAWECPSKAPECPQHFRIKFENARSRDGTAAFELLLVGIVHGPGDA